MKDEDSRAMFGSEQWLEIIEWEDSAAVVISELMGSDSEPKRKFIFDNIDFEEFGEV